MLGRKHGQGEEEWVRFASFTEAGQRLGLHAGHISRCCGKQGRKTTGGNEFKYAEGNEDDVLEG